MNAVSKPALVNSIGPAKTGLGSGMARASATKKPPSTIKPKAPSLAKVDRFCNSAPSPTPKWLTKAKPKIIEAAIRYPGFSFVNIQSPCVSFGDAENQAKVQKTRMRKLEAEGHDPTDRLRAMELAQDYGKTLYTGIFYQNPNPPPTYGDQIKALQQQLMPPPEVG